MRRILHLLTALIAAVLICTTLSAPAHAATSVRTSQARLNQLGCNAGPVDGKFGEWTKAAVIRFQSRHGLATTGGINAQTHKLLFSRTAKRCDQRPVPASGKGRRIVISQGQNWVWLVGSDGRVQAQGGIIDNPRLLRKGTHRVASYCGRSAKIRNNYSAGGKLRLENFTRFSPCGIGFHRIPQQRSGAQIHADQLLGTNLRSSAGCIRVSASMARKIWDFGRVGTTVRVV